MQTKPIKRPWIKESKPNRLNKDPFYQSSLWKATRSCFMASAPTISLNPIRGIIYSNQYCADCWEQGKINSNRIEVDHVIEIKDGGSATDHNNLRSRCHSHHNSKTHAERKKRGK